MKISNLLFTATAVIAMGIGFSASKTADALTCYQYCQKEYQLCKQEGGTQSQCSNELNACKRRCNETGAF